MLKLQQVEDKIRTLEQTSRDDLTRPVAAFITFETQEGYERACNLRGVKNWKGKLTSAKHTFNGQLIAFNEAPEPTNILWENRDVTPQKRLKRKAIVVSIIFLLLLAAFTVFFVLKQQTILNYKKYPPTTDCKSISQMFKNDLGPSSNYSIVASFDKENTMNQQGTGIY